ncbi:hypothetical protein ABK040_000263 [Willaertia magna]
MSTESVEENGSGVNALPEGMNSISSANNNNNELPQDSLSASVSSSLLNNNNNIPMSSTTNDESLIEGSSRPTTGLTTSRSQQQQPINESNQPIILTPELIKRYTEGFKLFEQKKGNLKNHVLLNEIIVLMRGLLKNPKEKELSYYLNFLPNSEEIQTRGAINLEEFLKLMQAAPIPDLDSHFNILDAFEAFDTDFRGSIDPEEFKNILSTFGDSDLLTLEESNEMITLFTNPETKRIHYDDYIKTCLSNTDIHEVQVKKASAKPGTREKKKTNN